MKYNIGDRVIVELVNPSEPEIKYWNTSKEVFKKITVKIIGQYSNSYVMLVENDKIKSWKITESHIEHSHILKEYLGKGGWNIHGEEFIFGLAEKIRCDKCRSI